MAHRNRAHEDEHSVGFSTSCPSVHAHSANNTISDRAPQPLEGQEASGLSHPALAFPAGQVSQDHHVRFFPSGCLHTMTVFLASSCIMSLNLHKGPLE
jgi:hypothetical protein